MVAASWFSLMLLAAVVICLAVAGVVLTVVSRYTRAIGIVLLSILGMTLLVGGALVATFNLKRQTAYKDFEVRPAMRLSAERRSEPISREYAVRLAAATEPVADRDAGEAEVSAAADEESSPSPF